MELHVELNAIEHRTKGHKYFNTLKNKAYFFPFFFFQSDYDLTTLVQKYIFMSVNMLFNTKLQTNCLCFHFEYIKLAI